MYLIIPGKEQALLGEGEASPEAGGESGMLNRVRVRCCVGVRADKHAPATSSSRSSVCFPHPHAGRTSTG